MNLKVFSYLTTGLLQWILPLLYDINDRNLKLRSITPFVIQPPISFGFCN